MTAWLNFSVFLNYLILFDLWYLNLSRNLVYFLKSPVGAGVCLRGHEFSTIFKDPNSESSVGQLAQDRDMGHSGQMIANIHNLMKAKCQA